MSRSVICYQQPGKARSREVLNALAAGWRSGAAAAFFGCVGIEYELEAARWRGPWLYGDNSYTDVGRGTFFRFALNAFQITTLQPPDWTRFEQQRIRVRDWQRGGHVVVVEQSEHFLKLSGAGAGWLERTVAEVREHTDRPLRIRHWTRDKAKLARGLAEDLKDAHALVTWASSAAVEALLAGVPVFTMGESAAIPMASGALSGIEKPRYPDGREAWAAGLANSHWTLDELRTGMAWRRLWHGSAVIGR